MSKRISPRTLKTPALKQPTICGSEAGGGSQRQGAGPVVGGRGQRQEVGASGSPPVNWEVGTKEGRFHTLASEASPSLPCRVSSCSPSRTLRCSSSFSRSSSSLSFSTWGREVASSMILGSVSAAQPHLLTHQPLEPCRGS